jgi:hypothetical protein
MSPVVFYGRRTLFVTINKEHGLKLFKNRVLRKIIWMREGARNKI